MRCGHFMIFRFLRVCFALRIIRAPEYQPSTAPFIEVHLTAAEAAFGFVFYLSSACIGSELPAADEADKSLLTAFNLSVFIEGWGIAIGAEQFRLSGFLYCALHTSIKSNIDYFSMKTALQSRYINALVIGIE